MPALRLGNADAFSAIQFLSGVNPPIHALGICYLWFKPSNQRRLNIDESLSAYERLTGVVVFQALPCDGFLA